MKPKLLNCARASFPELLLATTNKDHHLLGIMAWQRQRICFHLAQRFGLFTDISSTAVVDMKLLLHPLEQLQLLQTGFFFYDLLTGRSGQCHIKQLSTKCSFSCSHLVQGLRHLLAQGRLTQLTVHRTPSFFAGPEPPLSHEQEFPSSSYKLQNLDTDDVAGILSMPICTLLSSSLIELKFVEDKEVERFTKEQEDALKRLTSLEEIRFWWCDKLQCLPAGLHGLPNLKRLNIYNCPAIRSLPKDGLPSSLQELKIDDCPAIRSLPKDCLPNSLQKLEIGDCPAIRSLPKVNDLPSSLQELHVKYSKSEELIRQCRKLIGIIPVVFA